MHIIKRSNMKKNNEIKIISDKIKPINFCSINNFSNLLGGFLMT